MHLRCPQNERFPSLTASASAALRSEGNDHIFEGLKAALDLAVHISPLTLLSPVAFKRWSMDRERLIEVR